MQTKLITSLFLIALAPRVSAENIELTCAADSHRPPQPSGQLIITEYALSEYSSNCPNKRFAPNEPISLTRDSVLYLWFRTQGDAAYLRKSSSGDDFVASFYLDADDKWIWQKDITMGSLDLHRAHKEAAGPDGIFDWRIKAEKWSLEIPGKYEIRIFHGARQICLSQTLQPNCSVRFRVEE